MSLVAGAAAFWLFGIGRGGGANDGPHREPTFRTPTRDATAAPPSRVDPVESLPYSSEGDGSDHAAASRPPAAWTLRLLRDDGSPLSGWSVGYVAAHVEREGRTYEERRNATTDADGRARVEGGADEALVVFVYDSPSFSNLSPLIIERVDGAVVSDSYRTRLDKPAGVRETEVVVRFFPVVRGRFVGAERIGRTFLLADLVVEFEGCDFAWRSHRTEFDDQWARDEFQISIPLDGERCPRDGVVKRVRVRARTEEETVVGEAVHEGPVSAVTDLGEVPVTAPAKLARLRVVDEAGAPVGSFEFLRPFGPFLWDGPIPTTPDPDAPGVVLVPSPEERDTFVVESDGYLSAEAIVSPGSAAIVDVVLTSRTDEARSSSALVDVKGDCGRLNVLVDGDGLESWGAVVVSSVDGGDVAERTVSAERRAIFERVRYGPYDVTFRHPTIETSVRVRVDSPETTVRIRLPDVKLVVVRFQDANGAPLSEPIDFSRLAVGPIGGPERRFGGRMGSGSVNEASSRTDAMFLLAIPIGTPYEFTGRCRGAPFKVLIGPAATSVDVVAPRCGTVVFELPRTCVAETVRIEIRPVDDADGDPCLSITDGTSIKSRGRTFPERLAAGRYVATMLRRDPRDDASAASLRRPFGPAVEFAVTADVEVVVPMTE
jgi:hypothetical protein